MRPNEQSMPVASRGQDGRNRETIAYSPSPEKVATIVTQPKGTKVSSTNSASASLPSSELARTLLSLRRGNETTFVVGGGERNLQWVFLSPPNPVPFTPTDLS